MDFQHLDTETIAACTTVAGFIVTFAIRPLRGVLIGWAVKWVQHRRKMLIAEVVRDTLTQLQPKVDETARSLADKMELQHIEVTTAIDEVNMEVHLNGGGSLKDAQRRVENTAARIESSVAALGERMEGLRDVTGDRIDLLKEQVGAVVRRVDKLEHE